MRSCLPNKAAVSYGVQDIFFSLHKKDDTLWTCQGGKSAKARVGLHKLPNARVHQPIERVCRSRKGYSTEISSCEASSSPSVPLLWKGNTLRVHGWLSLIVDNLVPFHICNRERFYGHLMHACVSLDMLMKYVGLLVKSVEQKKAGMLPDHFALMFSGWCNAGMHWAANFLTYPASTDCGF